MNPNQPTPPSLPEQPQPTNKPEQTGSSMAEQVNVPAVESAPQPGASAAPAVSTPLPQPAPIGGAQAVNPVPPPSQPASSQTMPTPAIADDVDVIEKEWVDHATNIIEATNQDPYVEEEAIEDLQVDYLKKRYGKEVKKDEPPAAA
jgi:hypothetical protein